MKALIVGLGSIGRRHIKNLKMAEPSLEIGLLRQHSKSSDLGDVSSLVSKTFFNEAEAVLWGATFVVIANPAPLHIATALRFAEAGAHLFIEKPLSTNLDGIDRLEKVCREKKLIVMVGYVLRFLPALQCIKQALSDNKIGRLMSIQAKVGKDLASWRVGDYRTQVTARKELGGGVVLELSHELDYVRWLGGEIKEMQAMTGKLSDLEIDVEDTAEIQSRHVNGVLSHIHLDMFDQSANRGCRVIGSKGSLVWKNTLSEHRVKIWLAGSSEWSMIYEEKNLDANVMHLAQWRHFLDCVRTNRQTDIGLADARRVLELSLNVLKERP